MAARSDDGTGSSRAAFPEERLRAGVVGMIERQQRRDFLEVARMIDLLGHERSARELATLNALHPGEGNQSAVTRFAEVAFQGPVDSEQEERDAPSQGWAHMRHQCQALTFRLLRVELEGRREHEVAGEAEPPHRGRITNAPGLLNLVDTLGRGGTEDWARLYQRARADPGVRTSIREALPLVDPETGAARALWEALLDDMEAESPAPAGGGSGAPGRSRGVIVRSQESSPARHP